MSNTAVSDCQTGSIDPEKFTVSGVPIIVYQMGKVGSSTILGGLEKLNLGSSVHHIHVLSPQRIIKLTVDALESGQRFTEQLEHGLRIREYLDTQQDAPVQVITPIREPISQKLSSFFQNIKHQHPHLIDEAGDLREREIELFVKQRIESYNIDKEWNCNWFDFDFLPALGVDVYQFPFDLNSGSTTIEFGNCRILILRLENSDNWSEQITRFLGLETNIELVNLNEAKAKDYKKTYRSIASKLKFSKNLLEKIYGTKFCRHFYTREQIDQFVERWCLESEIDND